MDFRSRGVQSPVVQPAVAPGPNVASSANPNLPRRPATEPMSKWYKLAFATLLFSITLLVVAVIFIFYQGGIDEGKFVNRDKYQAVFLNKGQVYFGHIKSLSNKFIDLQDIYYLQTNSNGATSTTSSPATNVSLVKLGCELHAPYDEMIINNDQLNFWENLQDTGQVAKAISDYKKQNPDGQKCSTASQNSTQQAPSTSSNPATNGSSPSTNPGSTNSGTAPSSTTGSSTGGTGTTPKKP